MSNFLDQFGALFAQYDVLHAFGVNLELTLVAGAAALVLGTLVCLMRISPVGSLRVMAAGFVNVFRDTPLTIIMVMLSLGVWTQLGVEFSSDSSVNFFWLAVIGLALYHAAFVAESIRSGVNTVPAGQAEAARAIGLSFLPAARIVILPQAFRGAVAPLGNTLIALIKNTTVAAAAGVATETSSLMRTMIEFNSSMVFAIFGTFAVGFVVIVVPVGLATTALSRKLAVAR
ncbi:MAG: ABC transporter permease subunit [Bifidobacteriaceae bacterium]|jgi:glutamate transport system permease protein|nr:ABC transporter permease subunit [Bifidobacteriaceae bacterium]